MSNKHKLSIFGEFDSDNIGDQLIGQGMVLLFEPLGVSTTILPLNTRPALASRVSHSRERPNFLKRWHRLLYRNQKFYAHINDWARYIFRSSEELEANKLRTNDSDIIVIGGGQLLHDNTLRMLLQLDSITTLESVARIKCKD